jgi:ribosomal protein L11 methyltransferase
MIWQELSIQVPGEFVEPISYLFGRYGHGLSVEDLGGGQVLMRSYLPNTSRRRRARIEVGVNLVRRLQPMGELQVVDLKDSDWETAWKAHFGILRAGRRLIIKPSWLDYESTGDEVVIELDPGMAFGTGHHPTTNMCLQALEKHLSPGDTVLDLGAGSGILSIAAARLGAASVVALDVDATAVRVSRKNFKAGGLSQVHPARGTLPHRLAPPGHFDLAAANISAKTVQEMAGPLCDALKPNGTLIASGIVQRQGEEVRSAVVQAGFRHLETTLVDDWVTLLFSRVD